MPSSVPTSSEFNDQVLRINVLEDGLKKLGDRVAKLESPTYALQDNFDTPYSFTSDNSTSPDGKWKIKYLSGGKTAVANGELTTYPATATASGTTYSTLVLSTQSFKNFQLDIDMKTNKQLRTGASTYGVGGQGPQPWETGWIMWRYNDELPRSTHHYYFMLKTNGYEFGKKDNAPGDTSPEKQIFLKTAATPTVKIGTYQHITVKAVDYRFTISVDGTQVVDVTDPTINDPTKMLQGFLGLYEEDSSVSFDNVKVTSL